jgi:integral membrane protein
MPLKYFMDWPLAVKYTGWAHGVLFVLYVAMAYYIKETRNWPLKRFVIAFLAAWLPLGTFVFDRELRKEEGSL